LVATVAVAGCRSSTQSPATSPTTVVDDQCHSAAQSLDWPGPPDESGDGLPPVGTATKQLAVDLVSSGVLEHDFGAVGTRVVKVDGRAWDRDAAGAVHIVRDTLYTVEVTVPNAQMCPQSPEFYNGVPLSFRHA
jgi:hypothetical protein